MSSNTAWTLPALKGSLGLSSWGLLSSWRGLSTVFFPGKGFSFSRWFTSDRLVGMAMVFGIGVDEVPPAGDFCTDF